MNTTKNDYVLRDKLNQAGINLPIEAVNTLRRAELTLQRWGELECGSSNDYGTSFCISRDEETGKPFMEVHPSTGNSYRYKVADREAGALKRIAKVCAQYGLNYFHQSDPRGCALYISTQELNGSNYSSFGVACCV